MINSVQSQEIHQSLRFGGQFEVYQFREFDLYKNLEHKIFKSILSTFIRPSQWIFQIMKVR